MAPTLIMFYGGIKITRTQLFLRHVVCRCSFAGRCERSGLLAEIYALDATQEVQSAHLSDS